MFQRSQKTKIGKYDLIRTKPRVRRKYLMTFTKYQQVQDGPGYKGNRFN